MDSYLKLLVTILPIIVVSIFFKYFFKKKKNSNSDKEKDTVVLKFPTGYIFAPLFALGVCILVIIYIVFCAIEEWPYAIVCGVFFVMPFLLMVIFWSLWRVEIRDEEFAYRNWFGKTKVYRYEDVELRWHDKGSKWYFYKCDKKVFCMPYYIEDGERLERRWKKVVKKCKENKE